MKQRTLKTPIRASGVGLHLGQKVLMVLRPAPANTGIVFRRADLEPPVDVPARATENWSDQVQRSGGPPEPAGTNEAG